MRLAPFFCSMMLLAVLLSGCIEDGNGGDEAPVDPDGSDDGANGQVNRSVAWGALDEAVIRPGAAMDGGCTFNWLFTDRNGTAYIGTAAHCTNLLERIRERDTQTMVGTVVFDSDDTEGADPQVDFSLIQLDDNAVELAHPAMFGWEAPTGVADPGSLMIGDAVAFYGHGTYLGDQEETRARAGVLMEVSDREYRSNMPAVWGDSGSPVVHFQTGEALGIISRFGLDDGLPTTDVGPLVVWILEELEKAGFEVELATV